LPFGIKSATLSYHIAGFNAPHTYNCHGYAFTKDGLSQYQLLINDYSDGAGKVLDEHYEEFDPGTEPMYEDIMHMDSHTNFVQFDKGAACDYRADQIRFKFRCSQLFSFDYDSPGRDHDDTWHGNSPEYYSRN